MRGVTTVSVNSAKDLKISTHTPHARRDPPGSGIIMTTTKISTHTPHARRDIFIVISSLSDCEISTHTPHARRDQTAFYFNPIFGISTHTPHARRDMGYNLYLNFFTISTHTPHARRDIATMFPQCRLKAFQLTRLMRGVTLSVTKS